MNATKPPPPAWMIKGLSNLLGHIEQRVAEHYGVTVEQLRGRCRRPQFVWPRHVAMRLMREHTTTVSVADWLQRDHTMVVHAVRHVDAMRDAYPEVRKDLEDLRRAIRPESNRDQKI